MQTLPQELVDKVVDELLELKGYKTHRIAPYSLISRAWAPRTQQHCFRTLYFDNSDELKKWCRKVTPDPAGVSRHTHRLIFIGVDTLEGCEAHIRAFTCVENVVIIGCNFLLLPSVAECFTPMGSGLIRLWIRESETTSRIIISLLAVFNSPAEEFHYDGIQSDRRHERGERGPPNSVLRGQRFGGITLP